MPTRSVSPIEDVIEDARRGKMVILVDDEDRENEGDFVIPAAAADAAAINFMAKHGRGLICLALDRAHVERLHLDMMSERNGCRHGTAFTVSIEAREGVSTGISAADRAHTIQVAIDAGSTADDIVSPGHVFPLLARDGGVLVRAGHTEAAVDLAELAGQPRAGVICEIMNEDGTMARLPDLARIAEDLDIRIGTIADLIAYRKRREKLVRRVMETDLWSRWGGHYDMIVYENVVDGNEHIALVRGDVSDGEPVPVRVHATNLLDDILGDLTYEKNGELHAAMARIDREGRGVIVLLRDGPIRKISKLIRRRDSAVPELGSGNEFRDYGVGAQILADLGVKRITLLSRTTRHIVALAGFGLEVVGQESEEGQSASDDGSNVVSFRAGK
jgi:3,4-dihydroxy 2-butanone 4-phosphate synthase/GTP cyclohydrolase II